MRECKLGHCKHLENVGAKCALNILEIDIFKFFADTGIFVYEITQATSRKHLHLFGGIVDQNIEFPKGFYVTVDDGFAVLFIHKIT